MIIFIVPKNSGLEKCKDIAKTYSSTAELIEVRGEDVPEFLYRAGNLGKRVIGITGEDLFEEYKLRQKTNNLEIVEKIEWYDKDFVYGKPTLCLLGAESEKFETLPKEITICINSKYRELSKKALLLLRDRGLNCVRLYVSGAAEEYFRLGLADLVIDIVCTGRSIKKYKLKVYDKIFSSDIVLLKPFIKPKFSLNDLYETIQQRIKDSIVKDISLPLNSQRQTWEKIKVVDYDKNSYTSRLIANPNELKRKLIEEAGEVITADSKENLIWESADLLYFLFVIMAMNGITIEDIERENEKRNRETLINKKDLIKQPKEVEENDN